MSLTNVQESLDQLASKRYTEIYNENLAQGVSPDEAESIANLEVATAFANYRSGGSTQEA